MLMCMCEKLMCLSRILFERQKISILMALLLLFFCFFFTIKNTLRQKNENEKLILVGQFDITRA